MYAEWQSQLDEIFANDGYEEMTRQFLIRATDPETLLTRPDLVAQAHGWLDEQDDVKRADILRAALIRYADMYAFNYLGIDVQTIEISEKFMSIALVSLGNVQIE